MSDAYEAWRDTKEALAEEPDSAYLRKVEEALRPAALLGYLAGFRGLDGNEEPLECDAEEAETFLAGLDKLRAPTHTDLWKLRAEMRIVAANALVALSRMNWTGEHTYGEALEDAEQALKEVLNGRPFPKLDRFRCPSLFDVPRQVVPATGVRQLRCQLQLPHDSDHRYGVHTWTDEQSVNPPQNHDEERDSSSKPHHLPTDGPCGKPWTSADPDGGACIRPKIHDGLHRDEAGHRWSQ
jgi:hypothetical protein